MKKLRTIIVDDEELARRGLVLRLKDHPAIELVAECNHGGEAVRSVRALSPDLMFLDIQMPEMDGFDVIEALQGENMPIVIFVTAFDKFAVDAFKVHAVDYVLKPIDDERLADAIERALAIHLQVSLSDQKQKLMDLIVNITGKSESAVSEMVSEKVRDFPEKISIKDGSNIFVVPIVDIDWIDAAGDYMCIHAKGETHVMRITMKELEAQLNPVIFQRVHRSTIVNLNQVVRVCSHVNGEYELSLECGARVKMSRSYKEKVKRFL